MKKTFLLLCLTVLVVCSTLVQATGEIQVFNTMELTGDSGIIGWNGGTTNVGTYGYAWNYTNATNKRPYNVTINIQANTVPGTHIRGYIVPITAYTAGSSTNNAPLYAQIAGRTGEYNVTGTGVMTLLFNESIQTLTVGQQYFIYMNASKPIGATQYVRILCSGASGSQFLNAIQGRQANNDFYGLGHTYTPTMAFWVSDAVSPTSQIVITSNNSYDGASILNFQVNVTSPFNAQYNTTNGTINLPLDLNSTLYNFVVFSNDSGGYYSREYKSINYSFKAELFQAEYRFSASEIFTSNIVSGANFTIGTRLINSTTPVYFIAGKYNITALHPAYFNKTQEITVTALTNLTSTITNMYNSILNVTAYSLLGAINVQNFTINLTGRSLPYSIVQNTTTYSNLFYVLNGTYNVSIDGYNYATTYNDSIKLYQQAQTNHTFNLYTSNSINFTFLYGSGAAATGINISLELISTIYANNYSTSDGSIYVDLLSPTEYTIRYNSPGYVERFYYFVLTNRTTNHLNLYLLSNDTVTQVLATVYDQLSQVVEGAYIKVLKYHIESNSYVLEEIVKTNFEGRAVLNLVMNTEFYKFIIEYPSGTIRTVTNPTYIFSNTINFQVIISEDIAKEFFTSQNVNGEMVFNNNTNNFKFTYSDSQNLVQSACLNVYTLSMVNGKNLFNSSCITGSSGSILLGVIAKNGTTYVSDGLIYFNATNYFLIKSLIKSFGEGPPDFGRLGVWIMWILVMLFAGVAYWSMTFAVILAPLPILIGRILGFHEWSWAICIGLEIGGVIVAYLISDKG